jgi:hypothetical protein
MCSPELLRNADKPLREPADLAQHTLLAVDMRKASLTVDWEPGCA